MVKITRISETKRGRFALFDEEDEFLFSIDDETLVLQGIKEGRQLTGMELENLRLASDTRRAKDAALRYLSLRAYGENELYSKLCQKYDEHSCAAAVATMRQLALLDDETFAMEKAKGMAGRGKSSFEIRMKLRELRIEQPLAERALEAAEVDDYATALRLVHKTYIPKLQRGEREKVMAALGRRGFSRSVAREAIDEATEGLAIEPEGPQSDMEPFE